MPQDSKVKRRLRRLKRENSLLFRQNLIQHGQMQQLANRVMKSQQEWNDLKATLEGAEQAEMQPTPDLSIKVLPDDPDTLPVEFNPAMQADRQAAMEFINHAFEGDVNAD